MLLQISTTHCPATDLGFLLHKHPDRPVSYDVVAGQAHVVWPQADQARATCALVLDIDPVALVRGSRGARHAAGPLGQYVNDRPYVASSMLGVALNRAFRTAMAGRCADRPELVDTPFPLELRLDVVAARGGAGIITRLFEPLGYRVEAERLPLDPAHPAWGPSGLFRVRLTHTLPVRDALRHLCVLVPVLDDDVHYWVDREEIDKLVRRGHTWLADHPEKDLIVERALKRMRPLVREAMALLDGDEAPEPAGADDAGERSLEKPLSLDVQRRQAVLEVLLQSQARSVVDLGCGEGRLLRELLKHPVFERVVGVDVSPAVLERAERRLKLDTMPERVASRLTLLQSSLTYLDARLEGFEAAACVEVIEHLDPERLDLFERVLFGHLRPRVLVLTTPNIEYNVRFDGLASGRLRHGDHRFEWTRAEFRAWAARVAEAYDYDVSFAGIGPEDAEVGAPTQMGVFRWR